uniref:Uncharacterized protein n=1 Tax=Opuntia streptacantha TaxID=393608 RepID=A0A7C9E984_OPUST
MWEKGRICLMIMLMRGRRGGRKFRAEVPLLLLMVKRVRIWKFYRLGIHKLDQKNSKFQKMGLHQTMKTTNPMIARTLFLVLLIVPAKRKKKWSLQLLGISKMGQN